MKLIAIQPLGRNRDNARLWIESQRLNRLGSRAGTPIQVETKSEEWPSDRPSFRTWWVKTYRTCVKIARLVDSSCGELVVVAFDSGLKLSLGEVVITPGAALKLPAEDITAAVQKHARGGWGELDFEDSQLNDLRLQEGGGLSPHVLEPLALQSARPAPPFIGSREYPFNWHFNHLETNDLRLLTYILEHACFRASVGGDS
jgi:hypothetical protein